MINSLPKNCPTQIYRKKEYIEIHNQGELNDRKRQENFILALTEGKKQITVAKILLLVLEVLRFNLPLIHLENFLKRGGRRFSLRRERCQKQRRVRVRLSSKESPNFSILALKKSGKIIYKKENKQQNELENRFTKQHL